MSDREETNLEEHLAALVDGDAAPELYERLADSDELRDLRFDVERAAQVAADAGADYVPPSDLAARLLAALDTREPGPTPSEVAGAAPAMAPTLPDAAVGGAPSSPAAAPPEGSARAAAGAAPRLTPETRVAPHETRARAALVVDFVGRHKLLLLGGAGAAAFSALAAVFALVAAYSVVRTGASVLAGGSWRGEVASVVADAGTQGLEICDAKGTCSRVSQGAAVPVGSLVRTGTHARARLMMSDGSEIALDRGTRLVLNAADERRARLEAGAIVVDVARHGGAGARFDVPGGQVQVLGTKFALRASERAASVDVSRGSVRLENEAGASVIVHAGEEGRIDAGGAPRLTTAQLLGENMAWSDTAREREPEQPPARGLGELRAKKPGEKDERANAVTLASHAVKVRVSGGFARTEIEEVFSNGTDDVLEGIFRFPLPPDAKIERLALDVDGKLEEGAFVERDRAAAIWRGSIVNAAPQARKELQDEIVWVPGPWRDPALLEWQRGGRFELRIYPIPKRGSRRIVLAYTQLVKPSGGVRRYTYPLAHDPGLSTRVGEFKLDLQVLGFDPAFGVNARGYALGRERSEPGRERLSLNARDFVPAGDLTVEYALPDRDAEVTVWAYRPGAGELGREQASWGAPVAGAAAAPSGAGAAATSSANDAFPYVAIALRPQLPQVRDGQRRAVVLVVDSSRSMFGESYRRATRVARRLSEELDPSDRVTVLACDTRCRSVPGGLRPPSAALAGEIARFLEGITPEGASDPSAAVAEAARVSGAGDDALRILYIGDGTPTAGPVRPGSVTRALRDALPQARATVNAVAIGGDSDLDTLQAIARAGGGAVLPYTPGQTAAEVAYSALGATYGHALREVQLELPAGLVEVAPERIDSILAGGESLVVARMTRPELSGTLRLKGKLAGREFEQRYPLRVVASTDAGNAFVPRVYAATRIADLEQRADAQARAEAVRLSGAFNVASRYTSLLVLESEAMFKAFGLDNARRAPQWTGEQEAESTTAEGDLLADANRAGGGGLGFGSGHGRVATSAAPAPRMASRKTSPSEDWLRNSVRDAPPAGSPSPAPPEPSSAAAESRKEADPSDLQAAMERAERTRRSRPPVEWSPPRRMVPMRRTWQRSGEITTSRMIPAEASLSKIAAAERDLDDNPDHRAKLKRLYVLYALAGDLARAGELAERWSAREPLDPEALTARADLAARAGDRVQAIRMLGSVVDVRPDDVKAQQRLARLQRWAGQRELGCRHSVAIAQLRSADPKLLSEAVRCSREAGDTSLAEELLGAAEEKVRRAAEKLLTAASSDEELSGDVRVEASWTGGSDLDVALIDPEGNRVSWLGAPNRAVITARDVGDTAREGLALRGASPGEYVLEIIRASGSGPTSGTLEITAGTSRRSLPFTIDGERAVIGIVKITLEPRLVPAW